LNYLAILSTAEKIYVKVLQVVNYQHTKTGKTRERHNNRTGGLLRIIHWTPTVGTEKGHTLPQHYEIIQEVSTVYQQASTCFRQRFVVFCL